MAEDVEEIDKIKVFYSEDEKLKILGELLSNKSSRDIMRLLVERESYTNQIAKKLDLDISLVIHHLKKMESIGLLEITSKKIINKGVKHRFFRIPSGVIVFPNAKGNDGVLNKLFREGVKFAAIGASAILSYSLFEGLYIPQMDAPLRPQIGQTDPLIYPLIVIIAGLAILYFKKNKKGGSAS